MTACFTNDQIKTNYDAKHDILCVLFGASKTTYEDDYAPGFGIIRDMFSDEVIGFSCYYYRRKQRDSEFRDILSQFNVSLPATI